MISHLMVALRKRQNSMKEQEKGFTLIELLVVIVIIGILAAIAIPVYLNVQNNAKDSSVQSDVANAKTSVIALQTSGGVLPASAADMSVVSLGFAANGFTSGTAIDPLTKITYNSTTSTFCIAAKSVTGNYFYVTDALGVTKATNAAAVTAAGCTAP